ncbi:MULTISPECIES: GntR family transcriptional regulator [unclassified Novosphingobium]|uniref:GntR family transcriptional regulator n=1 Tax=unclassified Novosphingobium TaxID=2644732 RepID=UPI00135A81FC|nr:MULTISPECIES: GntR family transcriptional regulator [unclassified Novosphingobium]
MSKASDQAYLELRARILSGELAPGTQLKEEELAAICGVSRTPVRDAIRRLETELFVRRTDSQRSFVAEWTLEDIEEVFTLRGMLEGYAVRRAASRADKTQIARMRTINENLRDVLDAPTLDVQAYLAANAEFHSLILEIAASDRLAALLGRLVMQPVVQQTAMAYSREQLARSYSEHTEITAALAQGDPDWAEALMIAHIRRALHARLNPAAPANG